MPPAIALVIHVLAWLAVPVGLICVIDDWLLRPRRQAAATTEAIVDPPFVVFAYRILPILIGAAVIWIFITEQLDFSLVLVVISVVTGLVLAVDVLVLRRKRIAAAQAAGKDPKLVPAPNTVEYARSFCPLAVAVLLLRAFVFEPYRIPSDSMMPTLLDGDFIVVDKFAYGLKLPVTDTKIFSTGEPKRGDVVVFHPPMQPSEVWIKRVVGLPGDHVVVRDDRITVNGMPAPFTITKAYNDGCYVNMQLATEQLSTHTHQALLCPEALQVSPEPLPGCKRRDSQGYICSKVSDQDATPLLEQRLFDMVVPPGEYQMMGDNRDNSDDGRFWGFVTEHELLGKATYIWFNWDLSRTGGPIWSRIGTKIP